MGSVPGDVEEDRRIATALMHGLATDTDDFMLARAADFRAASLIVEVCDRDLLQDLSRRLIAPTAMDVIARAPSQLVPQRAHQSRQPLCIRRPKISSAPSPAARKFLTEFT